LRVRVVENPVNKHSGVPAFLRVHETCFQILLIPPKISSAQRYLVRTRPDRKTKLTYFTRHRLLFFCSIVSGLRNWMPVESPMDFRRCWKNSVLWSGNNPAATKRPRRRGIRKSRGSSRFIYLVPPIETPLVVELSFRLLLSPFLFYCSPNRE